MSKLYNSIKNNFCSLPDEFSDPETSRCYILPVPYDQTVSYNTGTRKGPAAILDASKYIELYDNILKRNIYNCGIHTMDEIEPIMSGPKDMIKKLTHVADNVIGMGKFLVTIGGEHSVSLAPISAHLKKYSELSILHMDAHLDLRDSYWGTKYSHGSVMRRTRELTCDTIHVGIRSFSEEDFDLVQRENINVYYAEKIYNNDLWYKEVVAKLKKNVYITFDLDVFDPSIMPSVGTPEPGGLSWYLAEGFLQKIGNIKNIVGFDVVELSPIPGIIGPNFMAAKLIYKLIGYSLKG